MPSLVENCPLVLEKIFFNFVNNDGLKFETSKKKINENPVNLLSNGVEFLQRQNEQDYDLEKNNEGRIKIIFLN